MAKEEVRIAVISSLIYEKELEKRHASIYNLQWLVITNASES